MLLETLVPKAGTGKEPSSYLQPAWSCTTQGGQGNRHTHFPGKATLLAHDVLGTHDHIPLSFECSCHAQPELLKQPQQMGQNLTSWDFPCIELFGPTAVTGEPDEVGRAWEQDWGTSRRWWTPTWMLPDTPEVSYAMVFANLGDKGKEGQKGASGNWVIYLGTGK